MDEISIQQALAPGTVLDSGKFKYTIVKILGAGGFGITYLATCNVTVDNVTAEIKLAIKEHFMKSCIRAEEGNDVSCSPMSKKEVEQSREDFIKEATRLQKLCVKSRNIVNVNETFDANGTAYYVMEYIEGGSPKKMPEKEAVELIKQIAEGLSYVHAEKMLHLDIKPDNILLKTDKDGTIYPVLIDFGLAKHFDNSGRPTSHYQAKGASAGYSPQEQYAEFTQFSPKYDIYALGAVLLYLISGKNPPGAFSISPNQKELIEMIPIGTSQNVKNTILKAMKPEARERTKDIDEFLANLNCENEGTPTEHFKQEDPDNTFKKILKWIKNNWIACIIAAVTIAGITIALSINSCHSDKATLIPDTVLEEEVADETVEYYRKQQNGDYLVNINNIEFTMKPVAGSTFIMGAHSNQYPRAQAEELPKHNVSLSDFYIGETEVTQDLWKQIMHDNPSKSKGADRPVEKVSWNECQEFITRLNNLTGLSFRLPTEAEWEYAARGGNMSNENIYSGSNDADQVAWYMDNSNGSIHPVKTKMPNELGLYDMSGNVWEYCSDYFASYNDQDVTNPTGPLAGNEIVRRGGGVTTDTRRLHTSFRGKSSKVLHGEGIGLRLAIDKFDK